MAVHQISISTGDPTSIIALRMESSLDTVLSQVKDIFIGEAGMDPDKIRTVSISLNVNPDRSTHAAG